MEENNVKAEEEQKPETVENQENDEEKPAKTAEMKRIIEALLFASDEPIPLQKIKAILPDTPDIRKIRSAIDQLNDQLCAEHHPFEIVEIAGGFQIRTVQYYHTWVKKLFKQRINRRLSPSALETLAIIAYKQPLTKAEIESIRGVVADGAMKTLLERRLIRIAGRSEKPGRPLLYEVTRDFLKYFGLKHISDLPNLEEFEKMVKEKQDEFIAPEEHPQLGDEDHIEQEEILETTEPVQKEEDVQLGDEDHKEV